MSITTAWKIEKRIRTESPSSDSQLQRSRADWVAEYLRVAKACWCPWDESTWNRRWEEQFLRIFHMFPYSGWKAFFCRPESHRSGVTSVCVCIPMCKSMLCMCATECEKGSERVIMRIIPQVMRKGCTRLPHTALVAHKHWLHWWTWLRRLQEWQGWDQDMEQGWKKWTTANVRLGLRTSARQSYTVWQGREKARQRRHRGINRPRRSRSKR